jgi:hypothetical protein
MLCGLLLHLLRLLHLCLQISQPWRLAEGMQPFKPWWLKRHRLLWQLLLCLKQPRLLWQLLIWFKQPGML